jgi:hypothetical protein
MTVEIKNLTLNTKRVSYIEVDWYDLGEFIRKVYGIDHYDPASLEEWNNDSSYTFRVEKSELSRYETSKLQDFKSNRETSHSLRILLKDLCNQGLIEPGHYIIHVCW